MLVQAPVFLFLILINCQKADKKLLKILWRRTDNRRKILPVSKYSIMIIKTHQINFRKIPLILKYSVIIV